MRPLIDQYAQPPVIGADGKTQWQPRQKVMFAAWVTDVRFFKGDKAADGKGGRASYKLTFDDQTAQLSTWIDADTWPQLTPVVKLDHLVFVIAEIGASVPREGRESEPRMYRPEFIDLARIMKDYGQRVTLEWRRPAADVFSLHKAIRSGCSAAGVPVTVNFSNGLERCVLDWGADSKLRLDEANLTLLQQLVGPDCVKVSYKRYVAPVTERRFERNTAFAGAGNFDDE